MELKIVGGLNLHNIIIDYLFKLYEELMEKIEDYELGLIIKKRQSEKPSAIEISIEEL